MRWMMFPALMACVGSTAGCGGKPADLPMAPPDQAEVAPSRDRAALLAEAIPYYEDSPRLILSTCRESAGRLEAKGHAATADEILEASSVVMRRLKVRPARDQSIWEFCSLYESRRIDPWREGGRKGRADHVEAVDLLVKDEKFGNK